MNELHPRFIKLQILAEQLKKEHQQQLELESMVEQDRRKCRERTSKEVWFIDPKTNEITQGSGTGEWWNQATSVKAARRSIKYRTHMANAVRLRNELEEAISDLSNKQIVDLVINSTELARHEAIHGSN